MATLMHTMLADIVVVELLIVLLLLLKLAAKGISLRVNRQTVDEMPCGELNSAKVIDLFEA